MQYYYPNIRQPPYQINGQIFYTTLVQLHEVPVRLYEPYTMGMPISILQMNRKKNHNHLVE